jgi:hypothetical protein
MEDTRKIISIDEHRAADSAVAEKERWDASFADFMSQWYTDEVPGKDGKPAVLSILNLEVISACPKGLQLLHFFAIKYPNAYEMALMYVDVPPAVQRTLAWQAYCELVASCENCREAGPNSYC